MPEMKTPGVYVVEKNAFPNSVVEVATAIPAFIGYTAKADKQGASLLNMPTRISSMVEYYDYFGGAPQPLFSIDDAATPDAADFQLQPGQGVTAKKDIVFNQENQRFILYHSMALFYQNGGGPCYIVSVGSYDEVQGDGSGEIKAAELIAGIAALEKEPEPTMLVIPEAVSLDTPEGCENVHRAALLHSGGKMKNRVALLDIYNGYRERQAPEGDCVTSFRNSLGTAYLGFGAAYYPWLNTTIVSDSDVSFEYFSTHGKASLQDYLKEELKVDVTDDVDMKSDGRTPTEIGRRTLEQRKACKEEIEKIIDYDRDFSLTRALDKFSDKTDEEVTATVKRNREMLHKTLTAISPLYSGLVKAITRKVNLLPPSAAMAGLYTLVDNTRGVWKAPANIGVLSVISPAVSISNHEQADLNVSTDGKSVNAIRTFSGKGTLVWGARTLDGNSNEWRYISVRRTIIMLEESMRLAVRAYVFEANVPVTWSTVKNMLENFLSGIWRSGGLAGATQREAYSVRIGLGESMTQRDIDEGVMRVYAQVAVNRPAEFMVITIEQQMQKS